MEASELLPVRVPLGSAGVAQQLPGRRSLERGGALGPGRQRFYLLFEALAMLLCREPERSGDRLPQAAGRVTEGHQMPMAAVADALGEHDTRLQIVTGLLDPRWRRTPP